MSDVLAAADRNMQSYWEAVAALGPAPSHAVLAGAAMSASGLPAGLFNPAFVLEAPDDADATVTAVRDHYAALGLPFVLYFRDETAPGLADACAAAGLVEHYQPPLMVMDPIVTAPDVPPGVEVATVDVLGMDECVAVLSDAFEMPREMGVLALPAAILENPGFTAFLARVDGAPAATAAVFVSDGLAGIYNVATLPASQGRGLGAAVTWAAVQAGAEAGCTRSILQASGAGAPVYERMGFATPDRYRQFEPA